MILGSFGFHLTLRVTTVTSAHPCLFVLLFCSLSFSVGELNFDLFLTSSNNLTATVESNAATEEKKTRLGHEESDSQFEVSAGEPGTTSLLAKHPLNNSTQYGRKALE